MQSVSRTASPGLTVSARLAFALPAFARTTLVRAAAVAGLTLFAVAQCASAQTPSPASPTETSLRTSVASDGHQSVGTFEVQVYAGIGQPASSGTVTLVEDSKTGQRALGSVPLRADGTATLTTANLLDGQHSIHAVYSGDSTHAASASSADTVRTEATTTPTFTLSANPGSATVAAGATATAVLTLAPSNGFSNYVALSCSGLPLQAACNFTPVNVAVGTTTTPPPAGGAVPPATSTMTISTQAPSGKLSLLTRNDKGLLYAFLLPGLLGLAGLRTGRRAGVRFLAMALLMVGLVGGTTSCAQRYNYLNHPPAASLGTPLGVSPLFIEAISINGSQVTKQQIPFTLTVTAAAPTK
ncbi:MAG: Ig-like domain repeat protein [Acidobacteriaceae bacterium]